MPLPFQTDDEENEEIIPDGVKLREFGDTASLRQDILDRTKEAFTQKFPMENDQVRIEIDNVDYDQKKTRYNPIDTKKALLSGGRLASPLYGDVTLIDKFSGRPIDKKNVLLANVPYLSDRGTFVIGGNEFTSVNQSRLRAGIYSRKKDNGEFESHINSAPGTGPGMRISMEPETGIYRANIGQATIKLYPVLNALGVKDEDLSRMWGPDILKTNQLAYDKQAVGKFYTKFMGKKVDETLADDEKLKLLHERIAGVGLDPDVMDRTLGEPVTNLSPMILAKASAKLLHIQRGEMESDDRDNLANKYFMSTDDFLVDRVVRDAGRVSRNLLYKATGDRTLNAFKPGHFTPQLETLLVGNSLSQPIAGINPVELRDQQFRVIQSGEGGIQDSSAISASARNVHPSQAFFIDPVKSSESLAIGTDLRFTHGVKKGSDGNIYAPFRNRKTRKIEWLNPGQVTRRTVGFPRQIPLSIFSQNPVEQPVIEQNTAPLPPAAKMNAKDFLANGNNLEQ